MTTSMLEQELAPLEAQIDEVRKKRATFEDELRVVEAELETLSADRQRFDALRDVCDALDRLRELNADDLFWQGIPEATEIAGHMDGVRSRVASFEGEISGILEKQQSLQKQIDRCLDELYMLNEEVRDAYEREQRRQEEFLIVREISPVPYRAMVMPWTNEAESERRFRRAALLALLICFIFGSLIPMINVPIPDRSETVVQIPERLAKLVKKELPKPEPIKEEPKEPEEDKKKPEQPDEKKPPEDVKPVEEPQKTVADRQETAEARKKAESVGVLKFKDAFADLMQETPAAKLGTEASLSNEGPQVKGHAVASRSLVAMQAKGGSSGGIGGAGVSRNIGTGNADRLGSGTGAGFTRVASSIGGLEEAARPTSDGIPPGRTDEEIQIVFDRYKAALYRIYNKELRKDPTLRGKILMRITIEPDGSVSLCKVESTDLASRELVAKIIERVKKFNFGPKEGVKKTTILYPIDFLPAG